MVERYEVHWFLCHLFVATRLNSKMGIPDQLAYTLGNSVLEALVHMLSVMRFAILISNCHRWHGIDFISHHERGEHVRRSICFFFRLHSHRILGH